MAMQIYSKLERALGSIHIPHLPYASLRFQLSPSVTTLSRRLCPSGEDARGYRGRTWFTAKNGQLRQKIRSSNDSFHFDR